jgi:preprotein translocase SecE subunit
MTQTTSDSRDDADERPEGPDEAVPMPAARPPGGGFFSIYKPGQGYWVRMCTGGAVALLVILVAQWIYRAVFPRFPALAERTGIKAAILAVLVLPLAVYVWRYLNRPTVVDFLIETEKEMAKVNWTERKVLFGSTKVVITFVVLIALVLLFYDLVFGFFFQWIGILREGPLG